jgi:hypothetical protein
MARLLAIAVLWIAVAGCGGGATYSTDDVVDAFERTALRSSSSSFTTRQLPRVKATC